MTSDHDKVSRAELALIIKTAADGQAQRLGLDAIDLAEAERIAAEVGIDPAEFQAASRTVRGRRLDRAGLLGPSEVVTAEDTLPRRVEEEEAYQLLLEGQLSIPIAGARIVKEGENLWRLGEPGRGELRLVTRGDETRIAVIVERRSARWGLLLGPALAGGLVGSMILSGVAFVTAGTAEAIIMSNLVGLGGGSVLGFLGGRAAWINSAKRTQGQVYSAVQRIRALAGRSEPT